MSIIIAGIHTGIGKTICSAVICQALGYDYWKPVQAGTDHTDSDFIKSHVTNPACRIHKETYYLKTPASPHYAAGMENLEIKEKNFVLPASSNNMVVETAGGLMSPLAKGFLNIDLCSSYSYLLYWYQTTISAVSIIHCSHMLHL
jgi:dethiobiotin synthetase